MGDTTTVFFIYFTLQEVNFYSLKCLEQCQQSEIKTKLEKKVFFICCRKWKIHLFVTGFS